jgi:alcohol dehydrogenase class IV
MRRHCCCGGGSSIDAGKCIRVIDANGGKDVGNFAAKLNPPWMETLAKLNPCVIPQISVPTTSGTGAEVTSWAAISNTKERAKVLVGAPNIQTTVAVIDPSL